MFQIPQRVLERLKCSLCDGYLSSKPVMIKPENQQVCGKCFKILPTEEKEKCLRQIGLEALCEVCVFPCRYNRQGCGYTFNWDDERNHEEECLYRYKLFPIGEVDDSEIKCLLDDSSYARDLQDISYMLNLGNRESHTHCATEVQNNINLGIEGAVSLSNKEAGYGNLKQPILEENIYESLSKTRVSLKQCFNCKAIVNDEVYNCLFGHVSCINCKGSMCLMCVNLLEKESKTLCKNYYRGCKNVFPQSEINHHEANCQYKEIHCPLDPCKFKGILSKIKLHLKESHCEKVYLFGEVKRTFHAKDDVFIILCHESMFKCVYFYYRTFVEFFVTYVGSSEEAVNYTYEISVQSNGNSLATRRSKCSSWNDSMLEKGITFDKKELVNNNEKKLNFQICLRILHIK